MKANPTRPRLFDCFTYNGEADLLWLRMQVMRGVADCVVIAEATRTFTGKPKPLRFSHDLLPAGAPPVVYLVVDDLESSPASAWDNENRQRNALGRILTDAAAQLPGGDVEASDWVLLSDVDEIPRPQALATFDPARYYSAVLQQGSFFYAFNNKAITDDGHDLLWQRARLTTGARLRQWFGSMQRLRDFRAQGPARGILRGWDKLRTQRLADAGWHFSYLMTPEQIVEKLAAFSHQEFNTPEIASTEYIRKRMAQGRDLFSDGRFAVMPLDQSFPQPLLTERERYQAFIW